MTFDELLSLVRDGSCGRMCADSRLVETGDIFVAVKGSVYDGHDFIDKAVARGARYVVCSERRDCGAGEMIVVGNPAKAAAILAQAGRGNPAAQLTNLAVTGTNGKSTVAFLARSVIQNAGHGCGLIGTIIYDTGTSSREAELTTPDCFAIARMQQEMLEAGSEYMIIEASSHALDQQRLAGINFTAAAFTNLSGDHLDYHKTRQEYLRAKARLFQELRSDATAVLNSRSLEAKEIAKETNANIFWYAVDGPADIAAHVESMDISGTVFVFEHGGRKKKVRTPLLGRFNISNMAAAAGLCLAAGFDLETIAEGVSALKAIPGRVERIDCNCDFTVLVDYAHTDDALKNVLTALKPLCKGKLRVVFGCGGDRDRSKRARMAAAAEESADFVIVTSDNPRTEKPGEIIDDIVTGFKNPNSQTIVVEPDREKAIKSAVEGAEKNDIVLIAGKGHETYQIIGTERVDFNDKEVVLQCLKNRG